MYAVPNLLTSNRAQYFLPQEVGPCVLKAINMTQEIGVMTLKLLTYDVFIGANQICHACDEIIRCAIRYE